VTITTKREEVSRGIRGASAEKAEIGSLGRRVCSAHSYCPLCVGRSPSAFSFGFFDQFAVFGVHVPALHRIVVDSGIGVDPDRTASTAMAPQIRNRRDRNALNMASLIGTCPRMFSGPVRGRSSSNELAEGLIQLFLAR
jgi:hypothetical protein